LIFDRQAATSINKVKPVPSNESDKIIWKPAKTGECTSKSAFQYLNNLSRLQLLQQGPRSASEGNLQILKRVWRCKRISPVIKTFIWRLIRRAIATGARANNLTDKIDQNCALCGALENDVHLFFHCDFARAVWFSAKTPIISSTLLQEQDGVQQCLTQIIDNRTSDEILIQITAYLWFIWKARNDLRFRKRSWSVLQVYLAVDAYIHAFNKVQLKEKSLNIQSKRTSDDDLYDQQRSLSILP